jgi:hypothetical protein
MIILQIHTDSGTDEWKLPKDFKKFNKVKHEILSRYPGTSEVVSVESGIEIDRCKLENIFDVINPYNILTK